MLLLILFGSWVSGQVPALGADEYEVRERATQRLSNPLVAMLLPDDHDDPEVRRRITDIKARQLRWLDALYVESVVYRDSFDLWVRLYLVPGRSGLNDRDVFEDIHSDQFKASAVFRVWPTLNYDESFLRGIVCPGEYERWVSHRGYHLNIAPQPQEK